MSTPTSDKIAFVPPVIEFVTVGVEFCAFLEKNETMPRLQWSDKMLKLLTLLYLKALLLPEIEEIAEEIHPELFVKEEDYNRVVTIVTDMMGEEDVFLEVFVSEMKYSDQAISSFISESIADIYQAVRNFVSIYQYNLEEQMHAALYVCQHSFKEYWGQTLVNVLRPLHSIVYSGNFNPEANDDINEEDLWA